MRDEDRFFVITGGPGAGKTTLIEALGNLGFATAPEAGRAVIRQQQAIGGRALPWEDRLLFAEMMLGWDIRSHDQALGLPGIHLFDRGLPDLLGYLAFEHLPIPPHFRQSAELRRYNNRVFVLPPWKAIFRNDAERRQNWREAVATHDAIAEAYLSCGYELVAVPPAALAERCRFVAERLQN